MRAYGVHVSHDFAKPPERVFAYMCEHENLGPLFGAEISRVCDGDTDRNGVNSVRKLKVGPLPRSRRRCTSSCPNERILYRITRGGPLKDHVGVLEFSPTPSGGTHLEYNIRIASAVPGLAPIVASQLDARHRQEPAYGGRARLGRPPLGQLGLRQARHDQQPATAITGRATTRTPSAPRRDTGGAGGEHRAEHRRADRAAERAEEPGRGGRDAELAPLDAVLHRDHQDLRDHAEAEAEDRERDARRRRRDGSPATTASSASAAAISARPAIGKRL